MAAATGQNVEIYQNDDHTIRVPIYSRSGFQVALPGASAKYSVGRAPSKAGQEAFLTVTTSPKIEAEDVYWVTIALTPGRTALIPPGIWYHELEITDENGRKATVMTGIYTSRPVLNV